MNVIASQFTRRFAPNCINADDFNVEQKKELKDKGMMPITVILLDRVKDQVDKGINKHSLYYGPPGLGKSTVARVRLGVDVNNKPLPHSKYHALFVNCSKEGRIDDLRTKIETFCTTTAMSDDGVMREKVVFFDEIDGVSAAFFDGLRGFMDVYEKNVKFLATCNYINRVPAAIKSRFDPCINFAPVTDAESKELFEKYAKRLKSLWVQVLKREATDEAIHQLAVKTCPDIRSGLQSLQTLYENTEGKLTDDMLIAGTTSFKELYEYIFTLPSEEDLHVFLNVRYLDKGYEVLTAMHQQFVDYIIDKHPQQKKLIGPINIMTANYLNSSINGVDPFLCMKACVYQLIQLAQK